MPESMHNHRALTLGDVGRHYGVPVWAIRRLFERHLLPEPSRLGQYRVLYPDDLPAVEAALRQVGYLPLASAENVP